MFEKAKDYYLCGLKQFKEEKEYFHPGTIFLNTLKLVKEKIDFRPIVGMDTGGQLWDIMKFLKHSEVLSFPYYYNEELGYEIVNDNMMHFIKGSNWLKTDEQEHLIILEKLFYRLQELE